MLTEYLGKHVEGLQSFIPGPVNVRRQGVHQNIICPLTPTTLLPGQQYKMDNEGGCIYGRKCIYMTLTLGIP